jgi:hypothetical protein
MDKYITKSVYAFDRQGKNKIVINRHGNGPGDYIAMRDIYFDKKQNAIGIHCAMRKKLLYYNMQGQYIREESLPFYTTRVFPLSDNYLMYGDYSNNAELEKKKTYPNVILTTQQGKVLSSADFYYKNIDRSVVWSSEPDFSEYSKGSVSIKPDHCNIVYHATTDSIYPAYRLDFGEFTLDKSYWKKARENGATLEKVKEYCYNKGFCETLRMLEDNDYLFFKYRFKDKINCVFYSKKTGKMIHIDLFKNDIDDITAFFPILLQDNKMYCLLSVEDIFTAKKYLVENQLLPDKILNSVKEFDNPVIVAFTLKDF